MEKTNFISIYEELSTLYEDKSGSAGKKIKLVYSNDDVKFHKIPGNDLDLLDFKRLLYSAEEVKTANGHILSKPEKNFITDFTNIGTVVAESEKGILAWFPVQRRNQENRAELIDFKIMAWFPKKHVKFID